ncbi:MAG: PD-(D/E)XK nuclease-like domain-containing protein [Planctomyces sp.]|nr:PD-(D/E)XK nuclease-like domain-containing protein [Planctomyces sp.]
MACPKPGIYEGVGDEYFEWDAVSNSRLSLLNRSPKHYQLGFTEPTEQMKLGSLVHSGVLEPLAIMKRYTFMPNYANHPDNKTGKGDRSFSAATTFVKEMEEKFRQLNHDKEIITEQQYNVMLGMAQSLAEHSVASPLLRGGKPEIAVVWVDEETGLTCKAKADWLKPGLLVDFKTTADASMFEKAIANYGYHRQMAFYQRGLQANGIDVSPWIICCETKAPFGVRVAPMSEDCLDLGRREVDALLGTLVDCMESNNWPGYESPEAWTLPGWYKRPEEESIELTIGGEKLLV